jgi:hypothetical protein
MVPTNPSTDGGFSGIIEIRMKVERSAVRVRISIFPRGEKNRLKGAKEDSESEFRRKVYVLSLANNRAIKRPIVKKWMYFRARVAQVVAFLRAAERAGSPAPVTKDALVVSATAEPVCSVSLSAWRIARGS